MSHPIEPRRTGRTTTCAVCGRPVIHYRPTRLIPRAHWRHASTQQTYIGERAAMKARLGL